MKITVASHYGMCFGVRDALRATQDLAAEKKISILGQLVHNPVVSERLAALGVETGDLAAPRSAPTRDVVITAHGASDRDRDALARAALNVTDTTCPLVRKAHGALARLVAAGCFPVVIGVKDHVEVRGLTGDFPDAAVVSGEEDVAALPFHAKIGVISQTTQPAARVAQLVEAIRARHPGAQVCMVDTVCQPTKDRQNSVEKLARENQVVIVVGGRNSNNTAELLATARRFGAVAHHVATAGEVDPDWFREIHSVGITAGTSTLEETVIQVRDRIQRIAEL